MDDAGAPGGATGPIDVLGRTTRAELGARVEVEWALSAEPGLEWTEVFRFTSFDGPPDVVGDVVRWFVPVAVVDDAEHEVVRRVGIANLRCAP